MQYLPSISFLEKTLSRISTRGGQHIFVPGLGGPEDGIGLMLVEPHRRTGGVFLGLVHLKNFSALLMKEVVIHQIIHAPAPGKSRIELDQRSAIKDRCRVRF